MRRTALLFGSIAALACSAKPAPEEAPAKKDAAPLAAEQGERGEAKVAAPAPTPAPKQLSESDKALIAMDPATLSPEQRKARAHAVRRKILLNPDSPAARALDDVRRAVEAGEVEIPADMKKRKGPTLYLPGTHPKGGEPPAGTAPADPPPAAPAPEKP